MRRVFVELAAVLWLLVACGGYTSSTRFVHSPGFTIGGTVTGLTGSVVLQNNLGDNLTVSTNSSFAFSAKINNGGTYSVSVLTHPTGQTCSVSAGAGTVSNYNVSNVVVVCSNNTYSVGGSLSGLSGTLVLQNNNGDDLSVSTSGVFTFSSAVANGSPYSVTVLTQPTGQSCSLANNTGTIAAGNVTNVTITCAANTHTIGGTVSGLNGGMVLQNNSGDNLAISSNGSFTFPATITYGNGYSVSVLSLHYPNQACTITGGSGTATSNVNSIAINCARLAAPRYAFTASDNGVSSYVVDASSGRIKFIGKVAAGVVPYAVTVDPSEKYAYVVNAGDGTNPGNVSQYTIGANGMLTPMSTPLVATGVSPTSVTIDPSGKYAYVANYGDGISSGTVSQYSIGPDGSLTSMSPATVMAGVWPYFIAIDPSGKFVYVANGGDDTVSQYTIETSGALTAMSAPTVAAGSCPNAMVIDPSGMYAYVANCGDNTISQYTIGTDGALTAMPTATVASGVTPYSITVDPSGRFAYAANRGAGASAGTVSQYSIGTDGSLMAMTPATVAAGMAPYSVTVDPSGKFVYVANCGVGTEPGTVSQYAIGNDGSLTPISPATVADMLRPSSIVVSAGATPARIVAKYAYVANGYDNTVSQFSVGTDGALAPMTMATVSTGASAPISIAVDPSGKYVYVAKWGSNTVSQFLVGADGTLSAMSASTVGAGSLPYSIAVDPSGKYAYVANRGDDINPSTVSQYTIGSDGALTAMSASTVAAGISPYSVTVDPSGKFVYVANKGDNTVSQYLIGPDGALAAMTPATIAAGTSPYSVTVDPSGKIVYVANHGSTVTQYTIGSDGALTLLSTVAAGPGPTSVAVDPLDKYVYVANWGPSPGSVSQYTIGADGSLAAMSIATVVSGVGSYSVAVDPSGKYVYVANWGDNTVSQYTIGTDGALTAMSAATVATGVMPYSVFVIGTWQ